MKLNELSDNPGARQAPKRVGRGIGSGTGKTSGRGHKGQKSRSGVAIKGFEGGQMPIYRRLPKRGFTNHRFAKTYEVINLDRLQQAIDDGRINAKKPIDRAALIAAGLVRKQRDDGVRLLGRGELKAKLDITVDGASRSAIAAVEKAGGKLTLPVAPEDDTSSKAEAPAETPKA
jgi:large subunit ribosomal protein L15